MLRIFWTSRSRRFCADWCGKLPFPRRAPIRRSRIYSSLRVTRYPHFVFLPHIWRLRHNLSAYDAAYVALAEKLGATLITRDARLSSASARGVNVELF